MKRYYIYSEANEGNTYLEIYAGSDDKFEKKENMIKVHGEKLWYTKDFGKTWEKVELKGPDVETELIPEKKEDLSLPESPIDVAAMLINATVTNDLPNEKIPLSPLLEQKTWETPKYNIVQLEEIAKHLLLYCETKRKRYEDAFSENHKPQPL